ncbi:MAG: aldose 1-epimerase [Paracoccaceae bacterium]
MVTLTVLRAGAAQVTIAAGLGGGIARLNVGGRSVLRPWDGDESNPFSLASNVLVPFSNRISRGGFEWGGEKYFLDANSEGEEFPIHGDGFQRVWGVSHSDTSARLELLNGSIGPWRYNAVQEILLTETALTIDLIVTNTGSDALPFGCGFHPWFPRDKGTQVSFIAKNVWMENESFLPTEKLALSGSPKWDFSTARPLPSGWINNAFTEWDGLARIHQTGDAMSCLIEASENLSTAIVYSPDSNAEFFCFEPVSHPVDAIHLPGAPGLKELASYQSMSASMKISWASE